MVDGGGITKVLIDIVWTVNNEILRVVGKKMGLKVIGADFSRTATFSLKQALEQFGYGKCWHGYDLPKNVAFLDSLMAATDDDTFDFTRMFNEDVHSVVDYAGRWFWNKLCETNPDAKVILSIRDENEWLESTTQALIVPLRRKGAFDWLGDRKQTWFRLMKEHSAAQGDKESIPAEFRRHSVEVQRVIAAERLLVYRVTDGWEPLCNFLGVPVPDTPFPVTNSRKETADIIEKFRGNGSNDV